MKKLSLLAMSVLSLGCLSAPALAQTEAPAPAPASASPWYMPTGFYGDLGYSNVNSADSPHTDLNAVTARLGARFGPYLGVEAEGTGGFGSDSKVVDGELTRTHLNDEYAGYLVGFLPVLPKLDLLARVGYGGQQDSIKNDSLSTNYVNSFGSINLGAGAQYMFAGNNGVRVDYTRYIADSHDNPDSNVWSLAYVRKF